MRLTTKGRFAVTAMVDLAMRGERAPVTLAEISKRQEISLSYLEQLFGKLRRRALVASVRGPGGGYRLARDSAQMSVAEVILAVDEPLDATQCSGKQNCRDEGDGKCITHDLWMSLNAHLLEYLGNITLKQLVEQYEARLKADAAQPLHDMRAQEPDAARAGTTAAV